MINLNKSDNDHNFNGYNEGVDETGLLPGEQAVFDKLYEEISSSIKNPDVLQALLVERICLRAIQSKRLNYVAREYWTSLFVPEIIEPVMPEISLIHYVKQKAYDPKVNFKSMSKIANEIHVLEAGIENQIIKMMKALN